MEYRASFWLYFRNYIRRLYLKLRWYRFYGNFEGTYRYRRSRAFKKASSELYKYIDPYKTAKESFASISKDKLVELKGLFEKANRRKPPGRLGKEEAWDFNFINLMLLRINQTITDSWD